MKEKPSRLVYSSELGRICPTCEQPVDRCRCRVAKGVPTGDGVVRVGIEKKGRGGKTVTTITGLPLAGEDLKAMASELKRRCGTGGTVKDCSVEIQGDQRETVMAALIQKGYKAKKSGA